MNKKLLAIVLVLSLVLSVSAVFAAEKDTTPIDTSTLVFYSHTNTTEGYFLITIPSAINLIKSTEEGEGNIAKDTILVGVSDVIVGEMADGTAVKTISIVTDHSSVTLTNENDNTMNAFIYAAGATEAAPVSFSWKTSNEPAAVAVEGYGLAYLNEYTMKATIAADQAAGTYTGNMTFKVSTAE